MTDLIQPAGDPGGPAPDRPARTGTNTQADATGFDRWIYVLTAGLFLAAALAGFVPDSLDKIAAVQSGARPPFPPILHVHAVVTGLWIVLLFAQAMAMAMHRVVLHRRLGFVAAMLAPWVAIAMAVLVPVMRHQNAAPLLHASPELAASIKAAFGPRLDILLIQIGASTRFVVLTVIGLWLRRRDSATHRRLMILGTAALIGAATDRIAWLPTTMPGNPLTHVLWPLVLIAPMLVWDCYRLRGLQRAYALYFGVTVAAAIPLFALWQSPWWHRLAAGLLGVPQVLD